MELHALVCENAEFARQGLIRALAASGAAEFNFAEARSFEEAVTLFDSDTTDIVFVSFDTNTVGSLGPRFIAKLRSKQKRHVPIILVTGDHSSKKLDKMAAIGIDFFLLKPFTPETIGTRLEPIIRKFERARKAGFTATWSRY